MVVQCTTAARILKRCSCANQMLGGKRLQNLKIVFFFFNILLSSLSLDQHPPLVTRITPAFREAQRPFHTPPFPNAESQEFPSQHPPPFPPVEKTWLGSEALLFGELCNVPLHHFVQNLRRIKTPPFLSGTRNRSSRLSNRPRTTRILFQSSVWNSLFTNDTFIIRLHRRPHRRGWA